MRVTLVESDILFFIFGVKIMLQLFSWIETLISMVLRHRSSLLSSKANTESLFMLLKADSHTLRKRKNK